MISNIETEGGFIGKVWHFVESVIGWLFSRSWMPPKDFDLLQQVKEFDLVQWLFVPGYGYGFILVGFAIAELVRPQDKRPWTRASFLSGTYVVLAAKLSLYVVVIVPLFRNAWVHFNLPSLHLDQKLPLWAYMPLAILVVTFTAYWAHRGMHRIPICWNIHKIHHSVRNLNWTSKYHMHFLELLLHTPLHMTCVLLLGTDLVQPFGIIFLFIDALGHSNVRIDLGRLAYIFSTPQAHRIHHSNHPRHYDTNFGNTFMIWDHVFGTFCYDTKTPPTGYGVDDKIPTSFIRQQILPLGWIARDIGNGTARLFTRTRTANSSETDG